MKTLETVFSLLFVTTGCLCQSNTDTCSYLGNRYLQGDAWVDEIACDVCQCTQYGVQCRAVDSCRFSVGEVSPGDPVCVYWWRSYLVGDHFNALDGCNTCVCTARGMQCTAEACNPNGFAKPSKEPLVGECEYEDGWYMFETQWQAVDGCNTCYCATIGNEHGQHVCTTTRCENAIGSNVGK